MMGSHLYCIVPEGHVPSPELRGLDELPVSVLDAGGVAAWYSELERAAAPRLRRIRDHDAVVRSAASETVTPLPARFGQWFPDLALLQERVSHGAREYIEALDFVAGSLEFGVRFVDPDPATHGKDPPGKGVSGREYLRALAARRGAGRRAAERGESLARELEATLGSLLVAARVDEGSAPGDLAQAAHLVHRRDFRLYRERVEGYRGRRSEIRLVVTGPWPPYSFGTNGEGFTP